MDVLAIILLVISILGWVACLLLSTAWMNKILDRKGYHYPHIVFWLIPGGMITVTVVLLVLGVVAVGGQLLAKNTTILTVLSIVSLVFYVPLLVSFGLF